MRSWTASFAALVLALFGLAHAFAGTDSQQIALSTEEIGAGVYLFRYGAYRSLFVVGESTVIVTDPLNADAAQHYRQAIREITPAPVTHVIYSHSHWDRIAGGQVFKDEGAEFLMQNRCAGRLAEVSARTPLSSPAIVAPDRTFEGPLVLGEGKQRLGLYDFGPSHDKCLVVIHIPAINALYLPELVSSLGASLPVEDVTLAHFELSNIVDFFRAAENLAKETGVETVIVGHARDLFVQGVLQSEPATGPVALLAEQRRFWEDTLGYMGDLVDKGAQSMFLARIIDYERFENYVGYDREAVYMMLRRMITWFATG